MSKIKDANPDSSMDEGENDIEEEEEEEVKIKLTVLREEKHTNSNNNKINVNTEIVENKALKITFEPKADVQDLDFEVIDTTGDKKDMMEEEVKEVSHHEKVLLRQKDKLEIWKKYPKAGDVVEGTNIIPTKTFLMKRRWTKLLKEEDQFDLPKFVEECAAAGKKIGAIIDINCSDNYYTFDICKKKNRDLLKNVEYKKVKMRFDELPHKSDMNKIYEVMNKHLFKGHYTIIHCTHGVNRTGYAIAYFLCKKFQMKVKDAVDRFEKARGMKIKYHEIIDDLYEKFEERICRESIVPMHAKA
jgi:atypical dual specificity phosphatase